MNWTGISLFSHFLSFLPIIIINGSKLQISAQPPTLVDHSTTYTTYNPTLAKSFTMAKGKNHDRKANPGFGKTNGKANASTAGGEFTLKRVKG